MEIANGLGKEVLGREQRDDRRQGTIALDLAGDRPAQLENDVPFFRRFRIGEDRDVIAVFPEGQKAGGILATLAKAVVDRFPRMGEDAEGVGGGAHVEDVDVDLVVGGIMIFQRQGVPEPVREEELGAAVDIGRQVLGRVQVGRIGFFPAGDRIRQYSKKFVDVLWHGGHPHQADK